MRRFSPKAPLLCTMAARTSLTSFPQSHQVTRISFDEEFSLERFNIHAFMKGFGKAHHLTVFAFHFLSDEYFF